LRPSDTNKPIAQCKEVRRRLSKIADILLKFYNLLEMLFVGLRKRWEALNKETRSKAKPTRKRQNNSSTDSTSDGKITENLGNIARVLWIKQDTPEVEKRRQLVFYCYS
jgi:hypothetical protein